MADPLLTPAAAALESLTRGVADSPADQTAISLVESWQLFASARGAARGPRLERRLLVRVAEAGRPGAYRAEGTSPVELVAAARQAMAQARAAERVAGGVPLVPATSGPGEREGADAARGPVLVHDPQVAALAAEQGQALLRGLLRNEEQGQLVWWETAVTVVGSGGLARHLRATGVSLEVRTRRGPAGGVAAASARSLAGLNAEAVYARARSREAAGDGDADGPVGGAVVLAAEAVAALLTAVAPQLLAAAAWMDPLAFAPLHQDQAVLAAELEIAEDGAMATGLPFPLDLTGDSRRRAVLVEAGVLRRPVADPIEAATLGVAPTTRLWQGEPSPLEHLHLGAGAADESELLRHAADGVFVGELGEVECWDRGSLAVRVLAGARRRIAGGQLAGALPDAVWEVELPAALRRVSAVGGEVMTRPGRSQLGGVTAPGLALAAAGEWRPVRE
jgi:predicted Zn-dependent protease